MPRISRTDCHWERCRGSICSGYSPQNCHKISLHALGPPSRLCSTSHSKRLRHTQSLSFSGSELFSTTRSITQRDFSSVGVLGQPKLFLPAVFTCGCLFLDRISGQNSLASSRERPSSALTNLNASMHRNITRICRRPDNCRQTLGSSECIQAVLQTKEADSGRFGTDYP